MWGMYEEDGGDGVMRQRCKGRRNRAPSDAGFREQAGKSIDAAELLMGDGNSAVLTRLHTDPANERRM